MGRLEGKIALITGTAAGTGRAAAVLFAAEGAHVVGCDLDDAGARETARIVEAAGGTMTFNAPVDLADVDAARAWVDDAAARSGGIDVLYNNASSPRVGPFTEVTPADWSHTIRNELDLLYTVTSAAWPHTSHAAEARSSTPRRSPRSAGRPSRSRRPTAQPRAACSRSPTTSPPPAHPTAFARTRSCQA